MEIRDTGEHSHRRTTIEDARDALGATSMTAGVLAACDHAQKDVRQKRRAMEYLRNHAPKHVEEVAERLSTRHVPITTTSPTVAVGIEENDSK